MFEEKQLDVFRVMQTKLNDKGELSFWIANRKFSCIKAWRDGGFYWMLNFRTHCIKKFVFRSLFNTSSNRCKVSSKQIFYTFCVLLQKSHVQKLFFLNTNRYILPLCCYLTWALNIFMFSLVKILTSTFLFIFHSNASDIC